MFTARDAELKTLCSHFGRRSSRRRIIAITGQPGVGKTQLALAYAIKRKYGTVLVVSHGGVADPSALRISFASLAGELHVSSSAGQDPVAQVRSELSRRRKWLIVFDDVPNQTAVLNLLPSTDNGHVLVTSTSSAWQQRAHATIKLNPFTEKQSIAMLTRQDNIDSRLARKIIETVGMLTSESNGYECLPLILAHICNVTSTGTSADEYITEILADYRGVLGEQPPTYSQQVSIIWKNHLRRLADEVPMSDALLRLISLCAPASVPLKYFAAAENVPDALRTLLNDSVELSRVFHDLRTRSFNIGTTTSASLHQLLAAVVRSDMSESERQL